MTADLKPYPEMKDSGVPWLGEVPEHWTIRRAKWLFRRMERAASETDDVITCFRDGLVTKRKNRRTTGFTESIQEIGYQGIRTGDLVIHAMDAFAGAIGVSDSDGKGSPVYSVCRPAPGIVAEYYAHGLREMSRNGWILALAKGVRERSTDFRYSAFAVQEFPVPPQAEQDAIVRFIDYVDRRIRRYIRAKRKLIKLLEEQKQAIIHQAVTGQIDIRTGKPYPAYKPSGVEWLGQVPEHWFVRPLCAIARTKSVRGEVDRELLSVYLNLGVVRFADVAERRTNPTSTDLSNYQSVDPTDLVLNNQQAWRGSVGVSELEGIVSPAYLVLSISTDLMPPYANLLFRDRVMVAQYLVASKGVGSIQRNLYWPHLKRSTVFFPSLNEQSAVLRYVRARITTLDRDLEATQRQINLLNEYRTRLIADVVTGKLDVREAAASLPEEAAQSDETDELLPEIGEMELDEPEGTDDDE